LAEAEEASLNGHLQKNSPLAAPPKKVPLDEQLLNVTERAIQKADEILAKPFDETNGTLARAQASVINSALSVQARVDEAKLRAHQADMLGEILKIMEEERAKLPPPDLELFGPQVKR
jgi:hypothetical protein